MGREVRMVPKDWQHPTKEDGSFIPLLSGNFAEADREWNEGYEHWKRGECQDYSKSDVAWKPIDDKYRSMRFSDYYGLRPSPDDYMPEWTPEQATHLMMYETCSEGTPISPALATPEELARWLADNGASSFGSCTATYEQWLATCKRGWASSAIYTPKTGLLSGVEAGI